MLENDRGFQLKNKNWWISWASPLEYCKADLILGSSPKDGFYGKLGFNQTQSDISSSKDNSSGTGGM